MRAIDATITQLSHDLLVCILVYCLFVCVSADLTPPNVLHSSVGIHSTPVIQDMTNARRRVHKPHVILTTTWS